MRALAWLAVALLAAGCLQGAEAPAPAASGAPRDDRPGAGPWWSFVDTAGAEVTRDAPAANATVLFFMATWCTSCKGNAPTLAAAHEETGARGVRFLSVSVDPSEKPADLEEWKVRYDHAWPHGVDREGALSATFGVTSQSSVVVLDADGRVVERLTHGQVSEPGLRDAIGRALGGA